MKLETILKIENVPRKRRLLFSFIMTKTLPHSKNWKKAKAEYEKLI